MSKNAPQYDHNPQPDGRQLADRVRRMPGGRVNPQVAPLPQPPPAAANAPPPRAASVAMAQAEQTAMRIYEAEAAAKGYPPRRNN